MIYVIFPNSIQIKVSFYPLSDEELHSHEVLSALEASRARERAGSGEGEGQYTCAEGQD